MKIILRFNFLIKTTQLNSIDNNNLLIAKIIKEII